MMSLLEQAQKKRNVFAKEIEAPTGSGKTEWINQTPDLIRILNQVLELQVIPAKTKKQWAKNRTRIGDCRWELPNTQGKVSEHIWANMVGKSLEGMLKTIQHSQPNGDWKISDYEVDVRRDDSSVECIMLAVQFIDAENQPDLMYRNGVPETMNINVNTGGLSDDVVKVLKSKSTDDSELKDLLKQLIGTMASNAAPQAEPQRASEPEQVEEDDEDDFMEDPQVTDATPFPVSFDD
tara:strand:+ start:478 stop:1185 length:708 start_codon:yes stop_codon:yes gene_type:complete